MTPRKEWVVLRWLRSLLAPTVVITRTTIRRAMTAEESAAFERAFAKFDEAFAEIDKVFRP